MNTTASPDTTSKKSTGDLSLAFDVGHSSIGWAVLQNIDASAPSILGCGAVIFAADDCLASQRRTFRRQRRHVRSTRQRIARMKALLAHLGVLSREQLDQPGCAWPWQLAARALCGGPLLNWSELWDVLRWYAHNRGYDGNRRWSAADIETLKEDTEKEENAINLMQKNAVTTMAETFCKELGVDPLGSKNLRPFVSKVSMRPSRARQSRTRPAEFCALILANWKRLTPISNVRCSDVIQTTSSRGRRSRVQI